MEETSIYRAKEEILAFCSSYIDKKFESEKGLIKDYIGLGLKVAVAGVALALLTIGFFGWKSYDDINRSVQAEIKSRFTSDNPVAKYETLLKEAAIEGVIAALTARINHGDRFVFPSDDTFSFLVLAMQDDAISADKKSKILQFAAMSPDQTKKQIAIAARKLIATDFKDNRESGIRLMRSLIELYSLSEPKSFVTDALNILDKYKDEDEIVQGLSKMLDKMESSDASRILTKIGSRSDNITTFHTTMFNLRTNPVSVLDKQWFSSVVRKSLSVSIFTRDNGVDLSELLSSINSLSTDHKHFWDLSSLFAAEARAKGFSLEYQTGSRFDRNPARNLALKAEGFSFVLPLSPYDLLVSKVSEAFLRKSAFLAQPDESDLSNMEFWMLRYQTDSHPSSSEPRYKAYFLYQANTEIKDQTGTVVAKDRLANRVAIYIEQLPTGPIIKINWRDPMGILQSSSASKLQGLEKNSITFRPGIASFSLDDDL